MSAEGFELFSKNGGIYWGDRRVSIKGVNWFGFETADFALHGLWCTNMGTLLDFVAQHNFNAVRVPFSAELALNMDNRKPGNIDYSANPELQGLTTGQVVDRFVQECARRGLLVLLDLHRLAAAKDIPDLWYDQQYPEALVMQAWRTVVLRYKSCWNVFGVDLNNEPHGTASWGDGSATDWRLGAERLAAVALEANPRLLVFVEGVENNGVVQPQESCWWGGHCAAAEKAPIRLPVADKLVYSPHVYGPDVHNQSYFNTSSFPSNMPDIWSRHFGFIKQQQLGPAVCPGEWGGWARPGSKDQLWQQSLATWFVKNDITDSFYWCLNPNSGDTGGLLQDDWQTPNDVKLAIIATAHPCPTKWPQAEVQPVTPPAELCAVTPAELAACGCLPAAGGTGHESEVSAAAVAPPASQTGPAAAVHLKEGTLEVSEVNSWVDSSTPCYQIDVKITNTGSSAASSMCLKVAAVGELLKHWNCTRLADDTQHWCFDLPDWCLQNGGLAVGSSVVVGLIVKGQKPSVYTLC